MTRQANPNQILLGYGVFYINGIPIGLSRGGGKFTVERETRAIEADGDRGYVKGRIVVDKATPKLVVNALEVIHENLPKLYTALKLTKEDDKSKLTGTLEIVDSDYQDVVKWVGKTKGGKEVVIAIENAINLENMDWTLADKDEVVAALTYTGCYEEDSPDNYEPWSVTFVG